MMVLLLIVKREKNQLLVPEISCEILPAVEVGCN